MIANSTLSDQPFALADMAERHRRQRLLRSEWMQPLAVLVEQIRAEMGDDYHIPNFDPCDGGINARVLFLLEAPGPKAVASGFISRNNPDYTAKKMCELLANAGIPRSMTLLWNIVPWYVGTGIKIRQVQPDDIARARVYLSTLLALCPRLQMIVLAQTPQFRA